MATERINSKLLDRYRVSAKETGRTVFVWDKTLQGFGAKFTPKERISWVVQRWMGGKDGQSKRVVIGAYPSMDLDAAKAEAGKLIAGHRQGQELPDRRVRVQAARKAINAIPISQAIELYVKRNGTPGRYWAELQQALVRELQGSLGKDTPVEKISKADVRHLLESKLDAGHDGAARNLYAQLRPFFAWCIDREIIATSPINGIAAPKPLKARDRVLTDDELKRFWQATEALGWPFCPFYRMLLLTAQRREEVAGMRWDEIEGDRWIIPAERTKNGKEHLVHISTQATEVLEGVLKQSKSTDDLVFSTTGTTPISGYSRGKARLDALMADAGGEEVKPWRIHDLRRTAASGMAGLGFQPHVIERVLNHVSGAQGGLVGVYQRYEYAEDRKRALQAWGNHLVSLFDAKTT